MKDFYYILGVHQASISEEIKKAYRKLSLKFHPDKNDGDDFFAERFKEIQEAYETLIDPIKRVAYDKAKANDSSSNNTNSEDVIPKIDYFKCNKSPFEFNEEITFSWKTINANKVTIQPFGQVPPIGQKTYKIKDFKNQVLNFELIAENSNINSQVKTTIALTNKNYQEIYQFFKNKIDEDNLKYSSQFHSSDNTQNRQPTNLNSRKQRKKDEGVKNNHRTAIFAIVGLIIYFIILISYLSS
jgi:curved DNA-binding protein CbpA